MLRKQLEFGDVQLLYYTLDCLSRVMRACILHERAAMRPSGGRGRNQALMSDSGLHGLAERHLPWGW